MKTFNEIYILDLHGNSLKKEKCPDGSSDQNVFDIRQGVAIALFIKKREQGKECKIYHSDLWGLRDKKYSWLNSHDMENTNWTFITPKSEYYLFKPSDEVNLKIYSCFIKITDLMPANVMGVQTHRDEFVIDINHDSLKRRINMFRDPKVPDDLIQQAFNLKNTTDWDLSNKRKKIQQDEKWEEKFVKCLYRPFDVRWIFYHKSAIDRDREEIMHHMLNEKNLALLVSRRASKFWKHAFIIENIAVDVAISSSSREGNQFFPLYLCNTSKNYTLFSKQEDKESNFSKDVLKIFALNFHNSPSPENILYYVYSIMYSEIYRNKYLDFLKIDFPRIPFTKDYDIFIKMAKRGERLVHLHLLRSDELDSPLVKSQGKGNNLIDTLKYDAEEKRVYYNTEQYFEGVTKDIWEYQIGGYQVCSKWLKDRKGKMLSASEIKHHCQICNAIHKTIDIQKEIDDIYPEVEKDTIKF